MTMLTLKQVEERLHKYEGLVHATAKYWRDSIPLEYDTEDIKQELRLKVWKALCKWDPEHPKALPEEKHVFGAVRNTVTDLQRKGNRLMVDEVLTDRMPGEDTATLGSTLGRPTGLGHFQIPLPKNGEGVTGDQEATEAIALLPHTHQRMAMMIVVGYSKSEVMEKLDLTVTSYREHLNSLTTHLKGVREGRQVRITFSTSEIRRMTPDEQMNVASGEVA